MIYFLWTAIIFFSFIIQGSISLFDVTPNLTVVLACYAGIKKGEVNGIFIGSLIGIVEDSLSGAFLGPHLLSKSLVGYFSSLMYNRFFVWTPLLAVISISLLTVTDSFIVFTSRSIFDKMPVNIGTAAFIIGMQSLLNAPFGLFIKPKKEE